MLFIVVGRDINNWYARYSSCIWSTMAAKSQHVKLKKTTIQQVIINMENSSLRHDILLIIITKYWNCCCILPSSPQFQSYHHHNADAISIVPSPPNPLPSSSPASKPPPYSYSLTDNDARRWRWWWSRCRRDDGTTMEMMMKSLSASSPIIHLQRKRGNENYELRLRRNGR